MPFSLSAEGTSLYLLAKVGELDRCLKEMET